MSAARAYIKAIRNDAKRRYATDYLAYLQHGGGEPERDAYGLTYMAAQAVRANLAQLDQTGTLTRR
jgi:hypothetical protein